MNLAIPQFGRSVLASLDLGDGIFCTNALPLHQDIDGLLSNTKFNGLIINNDPVMWLRRFGFHINLHRLFWSKMTRLNQRKNRTSTYISSFGPIGETQSFSPIFNKLDIAPITRLLCSRSPFAVLWTVFLIIINSFQRMKIRWSWANIVKEVHKRLAPSIAHKNATTSIINVSPIIRIVAPLKHPGPNFVFGRFAHAVYSLAISRLFPVKASAAFGVAKSQIRTGNIFDCPAITSTLPHGIMKATATGRFRDTPKNNKSPESLIRKINKPSHNPLRLLTETHILGD